MLLNFKCLSIEISKKQRNTFNDGFNFKTWYYICSYLKHFQDTNPPFYRLTNLTHISKTKCEVVIQFPVVSFAHKFTQGCCWFYLNRILGMIYKKNKNALSDSQYGNSLFVESHSTDRITFFKSTKSGINECEISLWIVFFRIFKHQEDVHPLQIEPLFTWYK